MSAGAPILLADAEKAAAFLFHRWALDPAACMVVGSVRRRRELVGDLELIAPAWDGKGQDQVFDRIAATMEGEHPAYKPSPTGLFEPEAPEVIRCEKGIGHALMGLRPGFLHARLSLRRRDGSEIPCEVYRYTPQNRGWITLMRTGPGDFGRLFLRYWKHAHEIPFGFEASIDGHLRDARGEVVTVTSEEQCFEKCGLKFMPPEERDERAAAWEQYFRMGARAIR